MTSVSVRVDVREYPDDDGEYTTMTIRNHWNRKDRVKIEIGGKQYTFISKHLIEAIKAAEHAHT